MHKGQEMSNSFKSLEFFRPQSHQVITRNEQITLKQQYLYKIKWRENQTQACQERSKDGQKQHKAKGVKGVKKGTKQ